MIDLLKTFLKKLTNLTGQNKSLLFLKTGRDQDLDLNELDFLNGKSSFEIISHLISRKNSIELIPYFDSRNEKVNQLSRILTKIVRKEKQIFEERGARDLYVGWPFVHGKFKDGTVVRCPLIYFPVCLSHDEKNWKLELAQDTETGFNKSFLLAYVHYNEIVLPDEFFEFDFDEFDKDSKVFRTSLYQYLRDNGLELNFNQELFIDKLCSFKEYKKADLNELFGDGELKLFPEAVLGMFPQAGSYLVPDYESMMAENKFLSVEEFFESKFLKKADEYYNISNQPIRIKEEQLILPFATDASQENAIKQAKAGSSLVIQGPPGTGKSQLISNLVADFIARGKNVLVVSQKKAALEVVMKRLSEGGLKDFLCLVNDFKSDRKQIYQQIYSQIERLDEYKYKNNSLDSIYLERNFTQVSRRIEQLAEELEEFRKALFDESEFGVSVKELYLNSDPGLPTIDLKQEYRFFKFFEFNQFKTTIKRYHPFLKYRKSGYIWNDRVSFAKFGIKEKKEIVRLLDHIPFYQTMISEKIREQIEASLDFEDFEWILQREEKIKQLISLLEDPDTYRYFQFIFSKNTNQDWLLIRERQINASFKEEGLETSLSSDQLNQFHLAFEQAFFSRNKFYKWIWWRLFSKDQFLVRRVFVSNKLEMNKKGFEELARKLDNRRNFEHTVTELRQSGWLADVPDKYDQQVFTDWFHQQYTAIAAKEILKDLRSLKDFLNITGSSFEQLKNRLLNIVEIIRPVPSERRYWLNYFSSGQLTRIYGDYQYSLDLKETIESDFDILCELDKIHAELPASHIAVLNKVYDKDRSADEAVALFQNSVSLEWINHIEEKYPVLRTASTFLIAQKEQELQECIQEKLKMSSDILILKARERTYSDVNFNRLNNMVTYRELKHQVGKKKKIWPIRKLFGQHHEEILNLIPCWLAGPEAVSAVFPLEEIFDLVVFDESSQCYAERGVPAIYRGKQIVVTGDEKQLPPNDLYQVRWENPDEVNMAAEVDSLLDFCKHYLPQAQLIGHYRSHFPELINFSNQYFYNNTLQLIPSSEVVMKREPAILYKNVKGVWENNSNFTEADHVSDMVLGMLQDGKTSIGVVSFNYKQAELILDLLEAKCQKGNIELPSSVFVKNIENVQGDEKDVIIFSIAYAPNAQGKMVYNFGSLGIEGGENRLNVAITRARERVIVVASIEPSELNTSEYKNSGPVLLQKYLSYAKAISSGKSEEFPHSDSDKTDSWYLKKQVIDCIGKENITDNGFRYADLMFKSKSSYGELILTDDNLYFNGLSSKELHGFLPITLTNKKWNFIRLYSRNWWNNRNEIINNLRNKITLK
ncbi:MAG: AAA domain-containing protein [Cytophagaceae bacterium]